MTGLRFGIDAEALRKPLPGVGQYTYNLCVALERELPDATFYAYGRRSREALQLPSERWTLRREQLAPLRKVPSFAWLKLRAARMCQADRLDVFWAPRTIHPGLPRSIKTLVTVHDVNHVMVPETMERVTRVFHQLWFERDVRSATRLLANSQGTADRLRDLYGATVDAIIRPGLHPRFAPVAAYDAVLPQLAALGVRPPYLLCVATLEPRKNTELVFRAFSDLKRAGELRDHQLVLVGSPGWGRKELLSELRTAKDVVLTGYVADELLPPLYALSDALVLASRYEGFGMPAREARACGTRLVISDVPELVEAAGQEAIRVTPTREGVRAGLVACLRQARPSAEQLRAERGTLDDWESGARTIARVALT